MPDSIPQLSLGTAALVIFAVCAACVMVRGITRMIVGTSVLALSAWLSFNAWQKAPAWSIEWFGKPLGWFSTVVPAACFIASFLLLRLIAKTVARPFGKPPGAPRKSGSPVIKLAFRLLFALVPAALLCLVGAVFIHHTGAIAEIRTFAEDALGIKPATQAHRKQTLKTAIDDALPESWLRALDPLANPDRLALAKAITAQAGAPLTPVIDPATGKPIPRAIIVHDPELQNLAREGKFGTLLRHPLLTKALEDPQLRQLLNKLNL